MKCRKHSECDGDADHDGLCSRTDESGSTTVFGVETSPETVPENTDDLAVTVDEPAEPEPTGEEKLRAENETLHDMNDRLRSINAELHVKLADANRDAEQSKRELADLQREKSPPAATTQPST